MSQVLKISSRCQPTEEQRKHLNIVNRDISEAEKTNIAKKRQNVSDLLRDIEEGKLFLEDLGAEQIEKLKKLLEKDHYHEKG